MHEGDSTETEQSDEEMAERKSRLRVVAAATAAMLAADVLALTFVVPWADEEFPNPFMAPGYIVIFFLVFSNFVALFAMLAHILHGESYPSDRWM